ncbi:MAG: universal stress protein [Bacteroidia bacterium]|nr:universal stress protein [Bacteroidia bacterium]
MKKILVPTDFSAFADSALQLAIQIAQKAESEIILLHIMLTNDDVRVEASAEGVLVSGGSEDHYIHEMIKKFSTSFHTLIQESGYDRMSYQISSGNVGRAIIKLAEASEVDLIVMGTQGEDAYEENFVGSTAERVVRLADCPVLAVPLTPKAKPPERIVLACDLEDRHQIPSDQIKQLQTWFDAQLYLVYINTPSSFLPSYEAEIKAQNFTDRYALQAHSFQLYCDFTEDDGIIHYADSVQADLIIVASHKRSGLSRLLSGSVSEGVLQASKIPVLIFNLKHP